MRSNAFGPSLRLRRGFGAGLRRHHSNGRRFTTGAAAKRNMSILHQKANRIAGLGDFSKANAKTIVNANGPRGRAGIHQHAFLSTESLIQDGRSQGRTAPGRDHRDYGRRRIDGAGE